MKVYRVTTLAALACAAGLSLTACSGGISGLSQPAASSGAATSAGASSAPAASSPSAAASVSGGPAAGSGSTVTVDGGIGAFPLPPGASLIANAGSGTGSYSIAFSGVTASEVTSFYTATLPSYGYTITQNDTGTSGSVTGATIKFTGHGYTGDIGGESGAASIGGVTIGSNGGGVTGITFTPAA